MAAVLAVMMMMVYNRDDPHVVVVVLGRKAIYKRKQGIVYHLVLTGPFTAPQFIIL